MRSWSRFARSLREMFARSFEGYTMTASGWIQLLIFVGVLLAITKPLGLYLLRVLDPERAGGGTFLDPVLGPIERLIYKVLRVDPKREHTLEAVCWSRCCSSAS